MGNILGTIICPFCFRKYSSKKLEYMCANKMCENYKNKKPISGGKIDRQGLCTCDKCNRTSNKMRCPECGHELPKKVLDADTNIIAIVGGKGTGKSYFVGTIIRQIMEQNLLSVYSGISTMWADSVQGKSRDEYIRRFKNYMDSNNEIPGTNFAANLIEQYPPILIEVNKVKKEIFSTKKMTSIFSFFDAAGESFEREEDLAAITPYLNHSSAIILILDPRQIGSVDNAITTAFPMLGAKTNMTYSDILYNVVNRIRIERKKMKGKLDIPICVCISKWDLVMKTPGLLPDDLFISSFSKSGNYFDKDYIDNTNEEIRSVLSRWDSNLVNMVESDFSEVRYFVFSAWGTPDTKGKGAPNLTPFRVEDPLLWIMNRQKMIG